MNEFLNGNGGIKSKDGGWDGLPSGSGPGGRTIGRGHVAGSPTMHEDLHMPVEQAPDGLEDAYEALMEAASEETGLYLKGTHVKALADWVNGLTNARDRVIERMGEVIAAKNVMPEGKHEPPPHEQPCENCWWPPVPMINAKQVLSLLSLSWPDGNAASQ